MRVNALASKIKKLGFSEIYNVDICNILVSSSFTTPRLLQVKKASLLVPLNRNLFTLVLPKFDNCIDSESTEGDDCIERRVMLGIYGINTPEIIIENCYDFPAMFLSQKFVRFLSRLSG